MIEITETEKKQLRIATYILVGLVILILFGMGTSACAYEVEGDVVYVNDSNVFMSAGPHTLGSSGWVFFNLTSKKFSGNIDAAWGFPVDGPRPMSAFLKIGGQWVDVTQSFNHVHFNYQNMSEWYYVTNVPVVAGLTYQLKAFVRVPISEGSDGKYFWSIKPSGETFAQALANGHLYSIDPWWNASWGMRKPLTAFNTTWAPANVSNFVAMVLLNSSVVNYSLFKADGSDIRFVADDNTTELAFQVEKWNTSGNSFVFVRIPTVSNAGNTVIWLYYNNTAATDGQNITGTWRSDYIGVWTLNETTGGHYDSTAGANYGSPQSPTQQGYYGCQVDGCDEYDGVNGYTTIRDTALDVTDDGCVFGWVYHHANAGYDTVIGRLNTTSAAATGDLGLLINASGRFYYIIGNGVNFNDSSNRNTPYVTLNTWVFVAVCVHQAGAVNTTVMFNGSTFINGSSNIRPAGNNYNWSIGKWGETASNYFDGLEDLMRITDGYITTTELNMTYISEKNWLFTYGVSEGLPYLGCSIATPVPVNASNIFDFTPLFNTTVTCYENASYNCSIYVNASYESSNASFTNFTVVNFNVSDLSCGTYWWNVTCTNTTYTNTSDSWVVYAIMPCGSGPCNYSVLAGFVWNYTNRSMSDAVDSVVVASLEGAIDYKNATCVDNHTLMIEYGKMLCNNASCKWYNVTEYKYCEVSCTGKVCSESILRSGDKSLIAVIVLMLALLVLYWAYRKEWFKWGV